MESCRFPKSARLTRSWEFRKVRDGGTTHQGRFMILSVIQTGNGPVRVGLITSKRVGSAVERNRVRRRLREIVRQHRARVRGGTWLVIIARRAAAEGGYQALQSEWLRLARRADIIAT